MHTEHVHTLRLQIEYKTCIRSYTASEKLNYVRVDLEILYELDKSTHTLHMCKHSIHT